MSKEASWRFWSAVLSPQLAVFSTIFLFSFFSPTGHGGLDSLTAFFSSLILLVFLPLLPYVRALRAGVVDFDVSDRKKRGEFFSGWIPFVFLASLFYAFFNDRAMLALSLSFAGVSALMYFFNKLLKPSLHMSSFSSAVVALSFAFNDLPIGVLLLGLPLVAYLRLRLKAHAFLEVLWGTLIGVFVTFLVFSAVLT